MHPIAPLNARSSRIELAIYLVLAVVVVYFVAHTGNA